MYYLIYKITNTVNNKIYIGKHKTENINDSYMGSGEILHKAFEKYGINKFKKEIVFQCDSEEEMNQMEAKIVNEEFIARLDTYNIKLGGQGGWDYCNKNLDIDYKRRLEKATENKSLLFKTDRASREKMSQNSKIQYKKTGHLLREGWKKYAQKGFYWKGKKHTKESKEKISKANSLRQKGELNNNYGKCWIYNYKLKESKMIKSDDLIQWIEKGWDKGRKIKFD